MRGTFFNTFKTFVLLAFLGAVFIGIGASSAPAAWSSAPCWASCSSAARTGSATRSPSPPPGPSRSPVKRPPPLRDRRGSGPAQRHADAPAVRVARAAAQRLRHRPRSQERCRLRSPQGILETLDDDELRGVLAHEIAHVRNRDILIGSVAPRWPLRSRSSPASRCSARSSAASDDEGGGNIIGLLALAILAPLAAGLLQVALSRS